MMIKKLSFKFGIIFALVAFLLSLNLPMTNVTAKADEGTSKQVENMLKDVINKYGKENLLFEDGIIVKVGEGLDLANDEELSKSQWNVENPSIAKVENGKLIGLSHGSTFIVGKQGDKFEVRELYVDNSVTYGDNQISANQAQDDPRSQYVVHLDAGHGGSDPGTQGNGITEKDYVLDISLRAKAKLEAKGVQVYMSRTDDTFVSLDDIWKKANSEKPDTFVSVHVNSAPATSAAGIETYYWNDFAREYGNTVHNKVINYTGAINRGLKQDNFRVITYTNMPSILVETGFCTNYNEANAMKTWAYQEKLVNGIVDGVMEYLTNNVTLAKPQAPSEKISATRISGSSRYETAYNVFDKGWGTSDYAVLASGVDYPDALSAAPLATKYKAPILLVSNTSLDNQSRLGQLLKDKKVKNVFITSGTNLISNQFENQIRNLGINVVRLSGNNRYETSAKIAKEVAGRSNEVNIVSGENFADGISISSVAANNRTPILLTSKNNLPQEIKDYINSAGVTKSYVIGLAGSISNNVTNSLPNVERIGGQNRYETNKKIFERFRSIIDKNSIDIASGQSFPDALSISALAGKNNNFVVLSPSNYVSQDTLNLMNSVRDNKPSVFVFGGINSISDDVIHGLGINDIK